MKPLESDDHVRIVEVGPRDGLQNEPHPLSVEQRVKMIEALVNAGIAHIEVGSFVSPKWVPQMADTHLVFQALHRHPGCLYSALTPNQKGLDLALPCLPGEVSVFSAASETFSQKNINCSIKDSIERFKPVITGAREHNIRVRGYVSCVVGCPYEGSIHPKQVIPVVEKLLDLGCDEISLGDTIGVGSPSKIKQLLRELSSITTLQQVALHCHDTYGQALVNIATGLEAGIRVFDTSVAGLGGCPYAKGASGNVATEDTLYFLHNEGLKTGVKIDLVAKEGQRLTALLNRANHSKAALAFLAHEQS